MKKLRITSIIAIALFISTTLSARVSPTLVDVLLMEISMSSYIQVTAGESMEAYVSIVDNNGNQLYYDKIDSNTASARVFDFSKIKDGTYTIQTKSDLMNVTKTVAVKGAKVEVISKESEIKPVFKIEDNLFKVNYLNQEMKDIELSLENPTTVFFEGKDDAKLNYSNILDISKLFNGKYFAKLEVGDKTFYHYFEIIR